jgi:hypothetical protein
MPPDADPTQRINLAELLAPHMDLPDRMAVAALDQMSWHLFCCFYLFEGLRNEISDALKTSANEEFLSEVGSGISQLQISIETTLAEATVMHFDRRFGSFAEDFREKLDAASDPEMLLLPFVTDAPQCQKISGRGVRSCIRPVIYIGDGDWSEGCETHASSNDRDRHNRWFHSLGGLPGAEARLRRSRQLTNVATALLEWWPTVDPLEYEIEIALSELQA